MIRKAWLEDAEQALEALFDHLRTPEGGRRAATWEADRLREMAVAVGDWEWTPQQAAEIRATFRAEADELDAAGTHPGIAYLKGRVAA